MEEIIKAWQMSSYIARLFLKGAKKFVIYQESRPDPLNDHEGGKEIPNMSKSKT